MTTSGTILFAVVMIHSFHAVSSQMLKSVLEHQASSEAEGTGRVEEGHRELQTVYDAVVIGAGWAGLGAARTLNSAGISNILVLEGRNYIGGRSRTVTLNDGTTTVELGSQWIHGASTSNPVYNVAVSANIRTKGDPDTGGAWSNVFGPDTPHRVPDSTIDPLVRDYFSQGFMPFQRNKQDSTDTDASLRSIANTYIQNKGISGDTRLGFEFALDSNIVQEYAASLEDLSLWWWDGDYVINGGDASLEQGSGKGYTGAINAYASPIRSKILLNSKVTSVAYTSTTVTITYTQNNVSKQVQAKYAIVAVPLGVLKKGLITFQPQLPSTKLNAINALGVGTYNKCVMRWKDSQVLPWPSNLEWLEKIAPLAQQGKWTTFYNEQAISGKKIVVGFSAGREAERVEKLTDAQIKSEALTSLRTMFGATSVPDPDEMVITRWLADPFSSGSYSYYKVGSVPKHRDDLRLTVGGRLYFAGEATHRSYPSTTHGALMTGQSAGQSVAGKLSRRHLRRVMADETYDRVEPGGDMSRRALWDAKTFNATI